MSSKQIGKQKPRIQLEPKRKYTDGDDASELAKAYGLDMFEWQRTVLDAWLGRNRYDKYTATSCGLSVPRQNGKNAALEVRELYGLTCIGEKILHTAHQVKTVKKAFQRLASFFDNPREYPELTEMVASIRRTNGEEAIYLNNGGSIEFSARSRSAARGFTVDVVVFDEAQELTDDQFEAIMSTMSAAPLGNRQLIYTGTPPGPSSPGEVFPRIRDIALSGKDKRQAWHEWSVEDVGDVSDRKRWYETNPSMGLLLDEEFTETEFRQMSEDGFARERLGWWISSNSSVVIGQNEWNKLKTDDPPSEGRLAFGVKFSPDGSSVALGACRVPDEGIPHVELVEYRSMRDGVTWLADWLIERKDNISVVVVDGKSHADELVAQLKAGRVSPRAIKLPSVGDVIASATRFHTAVKEKRVTHFDQPALNKTVSQCKKRPVGKNGGWGWGGIADSDSSPLEAVSYAYWGNMTTKRRPGRKVRAL